GFQVFTDLTIQGSSLADQVAAVANHQLQRRPRFVPSGLEKRAAGDRGVGRASGSGVFFHSPPASCWGGPGGRSGDCCLNFSAVASRQPSSPNGLPRITAPGSEANSSSDCGLLT